MPHFIIECSENILQKKPASEILQQVYDTAASTDLFALEGTGGINPYKFYTTVDSQDDFIHVFGNIMEGRSPEQKSELSHKIIAALKSMFPDVPVISMNIREFEKASYCNKVMV